MNIIIIIKQPLERIPPIINLIDVLIEKNYNVMLFCTSISNSLREKYKEKVRLIIIDINQKRTNNKIHKILNWIIFRYKVMHILKTEKMAKDSVLWIGSADAAIALGKRLFNMKYIFQCHELYDALPFYRKRLELIMQNSLINITPEENRSAIFRAWYSLKETPVTLPNKPFYHPQNKYQNIKDPNASQIIEKIKYKKIIIYQGGILKKRDITPIAKAIEYLEDDWVLVLMGNTDSTNYLQNLLTKYPKTVYIPPIPAPDHLSVTSWARIGLLTYNFHDLNHVFCAPNKTWEYSGFSIPMLGNNIPGIARDINKYNSGICIDLDNTEPEIIAKAINEIDNKYDEYSNGALDFYNSTNIKDIIDNVMLRIKNK